MTIASSETVSVSTQRDGRRYVLERHIDHLGVAHERTWLAGAADNLAAALSAYATTLLEILRDREISANIASILSDGSLATITLQHSTAGENRTALRDAYRTVTRVEAVMIGDYLNTLTNNQLATAFGITTGEAATLRTNKLEPAATIASGIRSATGA
jgi:hypothetical protein